MALLLLLAFAAPIVTRGHERRAALLFFSATVLLLAGPVFLSEYDYRFTIPAFGPLAATAAIGAWAIFHRVRPPILKGAEQAQPSNTPTTLEAPLANGKSASGSERTRNW